MEKEASIRFKDRIRSYAIKNAFEHDKAKPGKVLKYLFNDGLKRSEVKDVLPLIKKTVKEINSLHEEELKFKYGKLLKEIKGSEEKKELEPLPDAEQGRVVMRLAPFPSGALHIGNAKTYILNALYSEKYLGKLKFIMDDTIGTKKKRAIEEAYDLIPEAFEWLDINYEKPIIYKSDRLKRYYRYAKKLIKKGEAYVCSCDREKLRRNRKKGVECPCRQYTIKKQLDRWKEMFDAEPGDFTLRLKTNMQDPDPAFRDRVLFRISNLSHPKVGKKYSVWPILEFSWAIDDHLLGITHILRGKDLKIESRTERYIWDIFGWKHPEIVHTGMVRLEGVGAKISKSKAQKEIKNGEYTGWDDPRTWSIQSLRKRGFLPKTLRKFVKKIGASNKDIVIPVKKLYAMNRKIIDRDADRYSFVQDPVKLEIKNNPNIRLISVKIHPEKTDKRKVKVKDQIFISKEDYNSLKGKEVRLMHLFNIKLEDNRKAKFTDKENKDIQKLQWVSDYIKARVRVPDGHWIEGLVEKGVEDLEVGDIIQFERFGFVRFDKINEAGAYEFWFAHR